MKESSIFTMAAVIVAGLFGTDTWAIDGTKVNAFIVTNQWRGGSNNWGPAACDCSDGWAGNIELVTVQNGAVTKVDTIWNRSQGLGQYPTFNTDAQRIAFYRFGKALSGANCTAANGGVYSVSIMNRDGSNVKNLVSLRGHPFSEMALNWPVGDWVYYINPQSGNRDDYRFSSELRRVNVTTLVDELVYDWTNNGKWFRRFELTADGKFAGFQTYPIPGTTATPNWDLNGIVAFPPPNGSFPSQIVGYNGCNAAISASGTYASSYFAGNHTEISFHKIGGSLNLWLPLYDKTPEAANWNELYPNRGNINGWLPANGPVFNGSVINNSMGAEVMRWAANSDKWVLQQVLHYGLNEGTGSNCVSVNWVDKVAFFVSQNVKLPPDNVGGTGTGVIYHGNNAGDMWVDGGAATIGKWEDTTGAWHAIDGYLPTSILGLTQRAADSRAGVWLSAKASQLHFSLPMGKPFSVTIFNAQGAAISRHFISGNAILQNQSLTHGAYQVVASRGRETYCRSMIVSR